MQTWRMYRLIHILRAFKIMKTLRLTLENTQEKNNLGWSQHTETIFCVLGHKNDASTNSKWSRAPIISIPLLRRLEPASYILLRTAPRFVRRWSTAGTRRLLRLTGIVNRETL